MARRSATNQRYQKNAKIGSTRRSASSSKPKREAGTYSAAPAKTPEKAKGKFFSPLPTSPEIKKWRRIWYGLLALAVASYAVTLYAQSIKSELLLTIALGLELGAVAVAVGIDLVIIRKLRNKVMAEMKAGKKGGPKSSDKVPKSSDKTATSDNQVAAKKGDEDPS